MGAMTCLRRAVESIRVVVGGLGHWNLQHWIFGVKRQSIYPKNFPYFITRRASQIFDAKDFHLGKLNQITER